MGFAPWIVSNELWGAGRAVSVSRGAAFLTGRTRPGQRRPTTTSSAPVPAGSLSTAHIRWALVEAALRTATGHGSILSKMKRAAGRSAGDGRASTFARVGKALQLSRNEALLLVRTPGRLLSCRAGESPCIAPA